MDARQASEQTTQKTISKILKSAHPATIGDLARLVSSENELAIDFDSTIPKMVNSRQISVKEPNYRLESVSEYLLMPTLSAWFWTMILITGVSMLIVVFAPNSFPISILKLVVGSLYALYLPGSASIELLFPKASEITGLERIAYGFGLSIGFVSLIGLFLNLTPWGISFVLVVIILGGLTCGSLLLAAHRKYLLIRKSPRVQLHVRK